MSSHQVQIFVEGVADKKFLNDFLKHLEINNCMVLEIGGKNKIIDSIIDFEKNYKSGVKNIIIFDADEINKTREEFANYGFIKPFDIDVFLFPNNLIDGDLETILENIYNKSNAAIFDCWDSYETCLKSKDKNFTTPARKTKIYAYLEALLGESKSQKEKIKEKERNYLDTNHWDLNSTYLDPLKTFLTNLK